MCVNQFMKLNCELNYSKNSINVNSVCKISGCSVYFLQMIANISKGQHESVYSTGKTRLFMVTEKEKVIVSKF